MVTVENNIQDGGVGSILLQALAENHVSCKSKILAFPNEIIPQAPVARTFARFGLDVDGIAKAVEQLL